MNNMTLKEQRLEWAKAQREREPWKVVDVPVELLEPEWESAVFMAGSFCLVPEMRKKDA